MRHQMAHNHITCMLVICFMISAVASSALDGARVGMRHFDYGQNISKDQLVAMSVFSSSYLSLKYRTYQYMIDFSIGTPGQAVSGIADTGSGIIWTQCYNCNPCFDQPTPLYDPRKSTTYSDPCNKTCSDPQGCCSYQMTYGSGYTKGHYISDTIMLGDTNPVSVPDIVFGCSSNSSSTFGDTTGIVGLSRSDYSLISQLGISKFSYCLNPDANSINPMFLGSSAVLDGASVQSTPFVALQDNEHYHVSLTGISLGSTLLPISKTVFEYDPSNPNSGVIIDSGTPVTRLAQQAFQVVSQAVQEAVNLQVANNLDSSQLCFVLPSGSSPPSMPDMTFHFEGADLELPRDKYMYQSGDGQFCLYILEPPAVVSSQSIIGTLQLKDMHVLYDLGNNMLSFAPAECDKL